MSNIDSMKNVRLGDVLISQGYITKSQLNQALEAQAQNPGKRLGAILEDMGFVTSQQKLMALGQRLGIPLVNIEARRVALADVEKIPRALAEKYGLIAVGIENGQLMVAVNDPLNFFAIEEVRQTVKLPITLCLAAQGDISAAISYYYSEIGARMAVTEANLASPVAPEAQEIFKGASAVDAPVVRLLSSLLIRGGSANASDIHIEPFETEVSVRIRVDGAIVDYTKLGNNVHQPLIARIKILSGLDIAEKRVPQDGHFRHTADGQELNIRVSIVPTVFGEKAVLRFLSANAHIDNSNTFGMSASNYQKALLALRSPHGIIYLTGPTGSGKTTTLYMMLDFLAQRQVNIATIEDPVERNIPRVNQTQVNSLAGMTFDTGLRAILRQDPDIIMVGETRDSETASTSVRAAITGHLVLSTLHTNDAVSSIVRLKDMGVQPYLVANSLVAVVAQRLMRKICTDCAEEYALPPEEQALVRDPSITSAARGRGCQRCNGTGYRGRVAVHEILLVDKAIRAMITGGASSDEIFDYAVKNQGMATLRQEASDLVRRRVTTVEELLKTAFYQEA